MDPIPYLMYSFSSKLYFEDIDLYEPSNEYLDEVQKYLSPDWKISKRGFWTMCTPDAWSGARYGWKIHISSVAAHAIETLGIAIPVLAEAGIAFKFCSDLKMLRMSLSKTWSRFQVGKFITVYPRSEDEFKRVIQILHAATAHLTGPHVLTDRAYKNSRVIFYRYGAHVGEYRVDPYGKAVAGYTLQDGRWQDDIRGPSFMLPKDQRDPFSDGDTQAKGVKPSEIILNDRYHIKGAIKFSATGGIYHGVDRSTGREVIVREVRGTLGHLESEMADDPAYILKREARILERLTPTGLVPEFVELFREWNNWFLVEERLDAVSLWGHSMDFYFSQEYQQSSFGLNKILTTIRAIAHGLKTIHDHGVVLRDLTRNNVMFTKQGDVKFIDFEFAFELDDEGRWVRGWTPGYASAEQMASERPTTADDCYALGALILDMLTYCATGLDLDRAGVFRKLRQVLAENSLPMEFYDIVTGLTAQTVDERWSIDKVLASLDGMQHPSEGIMMFAPREELLKIDPPTVHLVNQLKQTEQGLLHFLDQSMDLSRSDRLWPACAEIFITNPVSLQYGAVGPAWFQLQARGEVQSSVLDWIERQAASKLIPPGLYSGLGGVALLQLQAGRLDSALEKWDRIARSELTFAFPSLYFGAAGWGLVNLHFWQATKEARYLEAAISAGQRLLDEATESDKGLSWSSAGKVYLGLGDGQSGIALFLTYLGAACSEQRFIHAAAKALEFDIAHAKRVAGRICWQTRADAKLHDPNLPHARFGSSGIGAACIRYFAQTGDNRFKDIALDCAYSVRLRLTNKLWQEAGASGWGEFLLDMEQFLGDGRFGSIAYYQAEGIMPHVLSLEGGNAFAGTDLYRVCSEFGTGSAGIGIFINRLLHKKSRLLMLDDLLPDTRVNTERRMLSEKDAGLERPAST
jgi:serine/threonine protein kinase